MPENAKVIIFEDNKNYLYIAQKVLAMYGHEIIAIGRDRDEVNVALNNILNGSFNPDVITFDYDMGNITGEEALQAYIEIEKQRNGNNILPLLKCSTIGLSSIPFPEHAPLTLDHGKRGGLRNLAEKIERL